MSPRIPERQTCCYLHRTLLAGQVVSACVGRSRLRRSDGSTTLQLRSPFSFCCPLCRTGSLASSDAFSPVCRASRKTGPEVGLPSRNGGTGRRLGTPSCALGGECTATADGSCPSFSTWSTCLRSASAAAAAVAGAPCDLGEEANARGRHARMHARVKGPRDRSGRGHSRPPRAHARAPRRAHRSSCFPLAPLSLASVRLDFALSLAAQS